MKKRIFLSLLFLGFLWPSPALPAGSKDQRVALVVGNADYKAAPLANPANDADDMAAALNKLGFNVTALKNADKRSLEEAINHFGQRLQNGGTGLFFFAGHGMQISGINYLIPVGANIVTEGDVQYEAVNANRVMSKMQDAGNPLNMVFLDACRNNPFSRRFRSMEMGLAPMDAPKGSLVSFATAPGDVAEDGTGRNGTFTRFLLKHIVQPGLEVGPMMRKVRADVLSETRGRQTPFEVSSLTGNFFFNRQTPPSRPEPPEQDAGRHGRTQAVPPKTDAKSFLDYEKVLKQRQENRGKWTRYQSDLESAFEKANTLAASPLLSGTEKADIWQVFLQEYEADNPFSEADDQLRFDAQNNLRKNERPVLASIAPKHRNPLKLAVVGPHSGALASYGTPTVNAAEILVKDANARGGLLGESIQLIEADDACKPEISAEKAAELASQGVLAVIGPICSGSAKAALGIYRDSGILAISPSATDPSLTHSGDYPNFFRTIASDDAQSHLAVDFALHRLGLTKIAVLYDKGDYGKGLAGFARDFLKKERGRGGPGRSL